ncbi:MAG: UDP-glucose 4-epimerase GalE [Planctomycetota bacterium]
MASILVTGGAGYIGSHTVLALLDAGHDVVVLDDLERGHRAAVRDLELLHGSLLDAEFVDRSLKGRGFEAVVHFAARAYVGESVAEPEVYYENNFGGTRTLVRAMLRHGIGRIVFSSTCATYGEPESMPIVETAEQKPINPYGRSKLMCEWLLRDCAAAHGLASVALRYFNAAGADPAGRVGEDHRPETHLIPLVLAAALGRRESIDVYGDDYPTPDGTCIRDYVHVTDLADAHVLALRSLLDGRAGFSAFNLGNAKGTSVLEVVAAVERVAGRKVPARIVGRRPGDPPVLVGSPERIQSELGWRPRFSDIESIVLTAHDWHLAHPEGYGVDA